MVRVWGNEHCHIVCEAVSVDAVISRGQLFKCTFRPEIPLLRVYPRCILAKVPRSVFKRMFAATLLYRKKRNHECIHESETGQRNWE